MLNKLFMKNKFNYTFALFITILFTQNCYAKNYFNSEIINPILLSKPLSRSSDQFKEEVKEIIKMQKNADENEIKKANAEEKLNIDLITKTIDEKFSQQNFPATYNLLQNLMETSRANSSQAKKFFATQRPYLENKEIKALIKPHLSFSYPSGHTCASYLMANILTLLIPQKEQIFRKRAEEIAMHRILVGMHYPHDIKGGKELALLVTGALLINDDFQKDFAAAKAELKEHKVF